MKLEYGVQNFTLAPNTCNLLSFDHDHFTTEHRRERRRKCFFLPYRDLVILIISTSRSYFKNVVETQVCIEIQYIVHWGLFLSGFLSPISPLTKKWIIFPDVHHSH